MNNHVAAAAAAAAAAECPHTCKRQIDAVQRGRREMHALIDPGADSGGKANARERALRGLASPVEIRAVLGEG